MNELPYAEDINYWQTSRKSPDANIDACVTMIEKEGGTILSRAFGSQGGSEAYMLRFELEGDNFMVAFPVLPTKSGKVPSARIQATRLIFHDIKHKIVMMKIKGARTAFFEYLLLPDGSSLSELSMPELTNLLPEFIRTQPPLLQGNIIDGEIHLDTE